MAKFAPAPPPENRIAAIEGLTVRPRDTVGDLLRRTRIEQGAEIETIAAALRMRAAYLAAIEQGRYDRLPGAVYALGFVRAYANHLGLDGEEAVRRFKLESTGMEQRRDLAFPMPLTTRSIPGGRMVLAAFVLAVCAYGIWHYLSTGDRARPERVAAVPADLMPPPPPPPAPIASAATPALADADAASSPPDAGSAPPPAATTTAMAAPLPAPVTATPLPVPIVSAPAVASPPAPPTQGVATVASLPPAPASSTSMPDAASPSDSGAVPVAAAPDTAAPRVYGAVDGPSHITLRAVKDCWIQVRGTQDGVVVAQRTLHTGDSYRVPVQDGLVLRTGNATGLEITVDDKAVPKLGGTVRTIALDPDRLRAGTARAE